MATKPTLLFFNLVTSGFPETRKHNYNQYYDYTDLEKYDSSRMVSISWTISNLKNKKKVSRKDIIIPIDFKIPNADIHNISENFAYCLGINLNDALTILNNHIKKHNVKYIVSHNLSFHLNILLSEIFRNNKHSELLNNINNLEKICIGNKSKKILKLPLKSPYVIDKYKMPNIDELYMYCCKEKIEDIDRYNPEYMVSIISKCFFYLMHN